MRQEELYRQISAGEGLRANLIELKKQLKEDAGPERFRQISGGDYDGIMKCLADGDPKVRKNAAAVLGMLRAPDAADVLMDAYEAEETLFVRPEYLGALAVLDCEEYLPVFRRRLEELCARDVPEDEKKHVQAEIAALRELLHQKEGLKKHPFSGYQRANQVVLTALPAFREALAADIPFRKTLLKGGVKTTVTDMHLLQESRLWQEMLFVINGGMRLSGEPKQLARELKETDLLTVLTENHRGDAPFWFRIGVTGVLPKEEKRRFALDAAAAVEAAFEGALLNSVSHYEAEIRLIMGNDGRVTPFLKLFTLPDHRFHYRKYHVASGMKPQTAAGLLALAKPWLRDYAQVLDPFCGAGTFLLERRFLTPVRCAYGIDIYGEAVQKARANTKLAGMPVNYINRDFFEFTHVYPFDEILADMPADFGDRAQADAFYRRFFEKAESLLAEHGRVLCYSREMGFVKKYLRLSGAFRLLAEFCITEKSGTYLFVLEKIRRAA